MAITDTDKKVWYFIIALTLLVLVPGLVLIGAVGINVGIYPVVGSLSWLVGGFMTWGYGKYQDHQLQKFREELL